jgi:hypothetical protein
MRAIALTRRCCVFWGIYSHAWLRFDVTWEAYCYTVSAVVLGAEVGYEWIWRTSRDDLAKGGFDFCIDRP